MDHSDVGRIEGPPRWVLLLGAAAVVAVLGVLARPGIGSSPELSIRTDVPAVRVNDNVSATSTVACGALSPVTAVGGVAYASGHPAVPVGQADVCYNSMAAARGDGFSEAPLPDNTQRIAGIFLVPISEVSFGMCVVEARGAGFEIPCMGRRPSGGVQAVCAGDCVTGGGYIHYFRQVPAPLGSCHSCIPDIVVAAAPIGGPEAVTALARCGPGNGGHAPWRMFFCDQHAGASKTQSHAGNTMQRGRHGGTVFAVSVGGRGPDQRALTRLLFESLVFVGP